MQQQKTKTETYSRTARSLQGDIQIVSGHLINCNTLGFDGRLLWSLPRPIVSSLHTYVCSTHPLSRIFLRA